MTRTVATTRELELADALAAVRARVAAAAEAAGRNVDEIELLPVTKFFPAADVSILHHLGCDAFGESREQEASDKAAEVSNVLGGAPFAGTWSDGSSAIRHVRSPGGRMPCTPSTAPESSTRWTAAPPGRWPQA